MKPTDKKRKDRLDYNMRNYERFFGEEAGKSGTIPGFLSTDEEALKQKKRFNSSTSCYQTVKFNCKNNTGLYHHRMGSHRLIPYADAISAI